MHARKAKQQIDISQSSERLGSLSSGCEHGSFLASAVLLVCRWPPSCCFLTWQRVRGARVLISFHKNTNAIMITLVVVVQSLSPVWLWPHGQQHTRLPCSALLPGVCSNSCPLSWWCCLIISSSAAPFSCCLQSFPESGSFLMGRLFTSGGQSIKASLLWPHLNLITSQRPHLQMLSNWGLGFQNMNFERTKAFNPQYISSVYLHI